MATATTTNNSHEPSRSFQDMHDAGRSASKDNSYALAGRHRASPPDAGRSQERCRRPAKLIDSVRVSLPMTRVAEIYSLSRYADPTEAARQLGGRPAITKNIKALARQHTPEPVEVLLAIYLQIQALPDDRREC